MNRELEEELPTTIMALRTVDGYKRIEDTDEVSDYDTPCCWSSLKNDEYSPAYLTTPQVPSGVYEIAWNGQLGTHTLKKQPFNTDELYELPSPEITDTPPPTDPLTIKSSVSISLLLPYP